MNGPPDNSRAANETEQQYANQNAWKNLNTRLRVFRRLQSGGQTTRQDRPECSRDPAFNIYRISNGLFAPDDPAHVEVAGRWKQSSLIVATLRPQKPGETSPYSRFPVREIHDTDT